MERLTNVIDPQEQIPVPWTPNDYGLHRLTGIYRELTLDESLLSPNRIKTITRVEIAIFCGPCDNIGQNGVCQKVLVYNQIRYAAREWCPQASINNERVHMTASGPQVKNSP